MKGAKAMEDISRRGFISKSAKSMLTVAGGVAVAVLPGKARAVSANEKVIMAVIGTGGRGRDVSRQFVNRRDVEMAYVCDADEERIGSYPRQLERIQGRAPRAVQDMRRVLDDKDVDAVLIATCDHWHGLATIWACQAGKDVYVEKPPCHNIWEGMRMVEAARKYNRVVQCGLQNRSAEFAHSAREYIQSGKLGDIPLVKVYNMKGGGAFTCPPDSERPKSVDYDLYLGPAPSRPFNRGHFHDGWKMWWAYGGGDMGDDGIHQLDLARFVLGDKPVPKVVTASGGRLAFQDDREVPDTQVVSFEYDRQLMTFELTEYAPYMIKESDEVRNGDKFPFWPTNATRIELYGTRGLMYLGRHGGGWQVITADGKETDKFYGRQANDEHRANFLDCVRTRNRPAADIEIGVTSNLLVHYGNMGVRAGGCRMVIDPQTLAVSGDDGANKFFKRDYREAYAVPEQV